MTPHPLPDPRVVVAGDWQGNTAWVESAIASAASQVVGLRTILHVGDFGLWSGSRGRKFLNAVDDACKQAGVAQLMVTPGNHEDWGWLTSEFASCPDVPAQVSEIVQVLPRGYRFAIGPATFLSFGGAASVDFETRREGQDWFPDEIASELEVEAAVSSGTADVLLTHETINGGTRASEDVLLSNPMRWSEQALEYSRLSRERITRVWTGTSPSMLPHGHMHVADQITLDSGQQVVSLGRDDRRRNLGVLELGSLEWMWLEDPPQKPRARRTRDWETQYRIDPAR